VTTAGGSEVAVPADFGSSPLLPGGSGIILPALRPAREVLAGLGQVSARVTPVERRAVFAPVGGP
jgi:hypothetical protein